MADRDPAITNLRNIARMNELLRYVRSGEPDLTNRQLVALMLVCWTDGQHAVRALAATMGVGKPIVTRIVNKLGPLGFLRRVRDVHDKRNVFIAPTDAGREFLGRFHG
jgi:DNA-binding MarR family transcriptional regulator